MLDPYSDDSFKLQDMIDSDIRGDLDGFLSNTDLSDSPHIQTLTDLAPATPLEGMDTLDAHLDVSDSLGTWLPVSQYSFHSDFDGLGSLLVNPQTGLPISLSQPLPPLATHVASDASSTSTKFSLGLGSPRSPATKNGERSMTLKLTSIKAENPVSYPNEISVDSDIDDDEDEENYFDDSTPSPGQDICLTQNYKNRGMNPEKRSKIKQENDEHLKDSLLSEMLTTLHAHANSAESGKNKNKNKNKIQSSTPIISYPKPAYSYSCLIAMALKNSETGSLPVNEIYNFMIENFPYFKTAPNGWKNSVRHNLSLNKCFEKIEKPEGNGNGSQRKGCLWAMNPAKMIKMDEEVRKWSKKDPAAIRKSMANPDILELLEKGHFKKNEPVSSSPVESEKEEPVVNNVTSTTTNDEVAIDSTMELDSPLPDIQKGIWEELDDHRLHWMNEEMSNPSASPQPVGTTQSEALISSSVSSTVVKFEPNEILTPTDDIFATTDKSESDSEKNTRPR